MPMDVAVRLQSRAGIANMAPKIHAGSFRFRFPAQHAVRDYGPGARLPSRPPPAPLPGCRRFPLLRAFPIGDVIAGERHGVEFRRQL